MSVKIALLILAFSNSFYAQTENRTSILIVNNQNLQNADGQVGVILFDSQESYKDL